MEGFPPGPEVQSWGDMLQQPVTLESRIAAMGMIEPSGPLEQYLLTNLDELLEHQELLPWMIYRFKSSRGEIKRELSVARYHQSQRGISLTRGYLAQVNPATGKAWAQESCKQFCQTDSVWQGYAGQIIELEYRDTQLESYEAALSAKLSLMPGLQGRQNRRER